MSDYKVVMSNKVFTDKLQKIADRKTRYRNSFPYNLCYYDGSCLSADCWNLIKALIWDPSISDNYTRGRYAKNNQRETGLGDWVGDKIMSVCTEVETNFATAVPGEFLNIKGGAHSGAVIRAIDGTGYGLAVESTASWSAWKVIVSKFDKDGNRYYNGIKSKAWTHHGKLPWINYIVGNQEEIEMRATITAWQQVAKMDEYSVTPDGVFGPASEKIASKTMTTKTYTKNLTIMVQGTLGILTDGIYGSHTEAAVKEYQIANGIKPVNGRVNLATWKKILGVK